MSEKPKAEKSLRAKSSRQKFEDIKILMSEKPKAEKSLRAKSLRQKFEDIKVLTSEKLKVEKSLRAKSSRQKFEYIKVLASEEPKAEVRRQKIFMSEDPRAGKSMSKEPKSKSRVKIHRPPQVEQRGGWHFAKRTYALLRRR